MGVFVCLPFVLPLTALPIARLAEQHVHPRSATRLLAVVGTLLALCSTPSSAHAALAALVVTAGTAVSAFSSLNAAVTLVRILQETTPL